MALRYNERTGMFEEAPDNPQINSFTFEGPPIRYNDESVTFHFDVRDAEIIHINDQVVPPGETTYSYQLVGSGLQNFVLRIGNGGIQKSESLQLKVLPTPIFNVEQSAEKLRKGKGENCNIKWSIQNAQSVRTFFHDVENNSRESQCIVSPEESSDYVFEAVGLDGNRVFRHVIHLSVFEESTVLFEADKNITLPHVPIKLSWDVKHAYEIELVDWGVVESKGDKIIECEKESVFTLKVTDEFGVKEYHQRIKLYPLPIIRSILVPTPRIERNLTVETHLEQKLIQVDLNVNMVKIPDYNGIQANVFEPTIPFHNLEFVLPQDNRNRLGEQKSAINIMSLINYFSGKLSHLWNR